MVEKFSEDWPLLQVHRQYGKNEAMKMLFDEISSLKFQIGELKSENEELKHLLKKGKTNNKETVTELQKDAYVQQLKATIKRAVKRKSEFEKRMIEWRNKYFDLQNRKQ